MHSGTTKQRLVGQITTDPAGNNVTAELENAFRLMNVARPWNFSLQLSAFTASKTAKRISPAASESGDFAGETWYLYDDEVLHGHHCQSVPFAPSYSAHAVHTLRHAGC
jgi:hypothetical protein